MVNLEKFRKEHSIKNQSGFFSAEQLDALKDKLPRKVIEFLKQEGKCTYSNDFIWTVLPSDYYEMLAGWGLEDRGIDTRKCQVFLRTSFGSLIFYHNNKYYYLSPFIGQCDSLGDDFGLLMNFQFYLDLVLNKVFWYNVHNRIRQDMPDLKEDEIYAINPSIEKGGSPETSKVEVVKMKEHLAMLAGLYDHRVTKY